MSPYDPDTENPVACPTCDRDDFASRAGMKRHHLAAHGESIAGPDVEQECEFCGETYYIQPAQRDEIKSCGSDDCYRETQRRSHSGENNAMYDRVELECPICDDSFTVKRSHADVRVTCGADACYRENMSQTNTGENNPLYNRVELECPICGEMFVEKPSVADRRRTCSYECYGEYRSQTFTGPDSPSWNGGSNSFYLAVRSALPGGDDWLALAASVRERAGHTCSHCGDVTPSHNAHHIIPVLSGGVNDPDLLIALCDECHMTVEAFTRRLDEIEPIFDAADITTPLDD